MSQSAEESAQIARIGDISTKIREAIRQSLPTPPEQHLTVMVPGKVLDLNEYKVESATDLLLPRKTELATAILCDDLPPLANIAMGPTGRSVARSYAAAISKLVPAGTPVGIEDEGQLSEDQKRYRKAMAILSSEVPDRDITLVELYTQKEEAYTKAVEQKNRAFNEALEVATKAPGNRTVKQQREAFDKWVQENAKTWRARVQAAYMDWVITGKKEEVEYWFAVVDQDSALARVEKSKEVMRWAVVQDDDGSCEYNTVKLTPTDWVNKCIDKMKLGTKQTKTVEWYEWEIERLTRTNEMLDLLATDKCKVYLTSSGGANPETAAKAKADVDMALQAYLAAKQTFEQTNTIDSENDLNAKNKVLRDARSAHEKANVAALISEAQKSNNALVEKAIGADGFFATQKSANQRQIDEYTKRRNELQGTLSAKQEALTAQLAETALIPRALPQPVEPAPTTGNTTTEKIEESRPLADFFTPITIEISSSSDTRSENSSATSFSFGAQASYGFFTASVAVSHSDAQAEAMKEMMNSNVKISFEVMRVDITRSWLRGELFYDEDLVPGPGVEMSPGFGALKNLMDSSDIKAESEKQRYASFPMYPVAFLVATNVVLEISGSTSSLHTYMNSSSTSGSASVGYGPFFSGTASGSKSSAESGSTCKATSSGCRIEMKAPQVIGWVSQLVPALPRLKENPNFRA